MSVYGTEESIAIGNIADLEKERLFRMALNEENEVNSLLAYYRDRVNRFDSEREDWLDKHNKLRTTQDEAHRQSWELQKRAHEIDELKRILEEEKLRLYEERQGVIDVIKENDQLKLKELDDRKKISELMLLGQPIEQEIVFYKDLKPETINRYMKNDLSVKTNKENYEAMLKKTEGKDMAQTISSTSKTGKGVIKTIYLPNDQLNTVAIENEELRAKLEENRATFSIEAEKLREELREIENELLRGYEENQEKIREYTQKNYELQNENIGFVKDYYELILHSNEVEKKIHEENELLRLKNAALANKLRIKQKKLTSDSDSSSKLVEKTSEKLCNQYRQDLKQKEEEITLIKDQHSQLQQIYVQKMKELEENLTKLTKKYSTLEKRRLLENEGFKTDAKRLKTQVLEYQKFIDKKGSLGSQRDDDEEERQEDEEARHAAKVELDLIQKQLNELEIMLDKARKLKN